MVISRTGYIITYANCLIIGAIRIETEIELSTTEEEYIAQYQFMRVVLPFVNLMEDIEFILKIQGDTPTVLCSLF